jgi:hypothetical protein
MENGLVINKYGTKRWYKNDLLHRTDGPAVIISSGSQFWYFEGKLHRTDGPAVIYSDGHEAWYFEGKLHRTDGPAIIYSNGYEFWYLYGKELTHEKWLVAITSIISIVSSSMPTNDYTCPSCKNDRCSKTEKSCWKCGNKL